MADTIRELAMQSLQTLLNTAVGFTAAEQVTRTPTDGPSEPTFPRIDIVEADDTEITAGDQKPNAKVSHLLTVLLKVWISGPDDKNKRLNNHIGEIEKVIRGTQFSPSPGYKLGGNAIQITIPTRRVEVKRDEQFSIAVITLIIQYRHSLFDPFAL